MDENNTEDSTKKRFLEVWMLFFVANLVLGTYFFVAKSQNLASEAKKEPQVAGESIKVEEVTEEPPQPEIKLKEFIEKKVFGYSSQGKPIEGYDIGNGENVLLLHASLHGDEMGTTDLLNKLVEEIKLKPELVASSTRLVVIPIANPDGYYDRTDKLNSNKVNLNLNFQTSDWQQYGPEGTFAGEFPFSENESQILAEVTAQYKPVVMLAFHAAGAVVSPEATQGSVALAKWYARKSGYTYYTHWDYPGTATKWFEETYQKPAITVELTHDLRSDWTKNQKALFELISAEDPLLLK